MSDRIKLVEIKANASIKPSHVLSLEYALKSITTEADGYVVSLSKFDGPLTLKVEHVSVDSFSIGKLSF